MREDTQRRFALVRQLLAMPYGDAQRISRDLAEQAWPPTGDADRSMEGAFRAMALAAGGNRPEESRTTIERIIYDLGESFYVEQHPITLDYEIVRKLSHCPNCHGAGVYFEQKLDTARLTPRSFESISPTSTVSSVQRTCGHWPSDLSD